MIDFPLDHCQREDRVSETPADGATEQPSPMTSERLAEIRKRADAATGGLWIVVHDGAERSISTTESGRFVCHLNSNMLRYTSDADFIAHARGDIPALLTEIDRLEGWGQNTMDGCVSVLTKAQAALSGALEALGTGRGASDLLDELDEAIRQLSAGKE